MNNIKKFERRWYFPVVILFMVPLAGMGIDIYVPSLPAITTAFYTSMHLVKLTIAFYLFGYAVGPLLFGALSDSYGRKKILAIGVFLYIISCLLIIISGNIYFMLVMRFIQGFTIGAVGAIFKAIMSDSYDADTELHKISAMAATTWAIGPILAPFIGGYLQHYFGWQANFVFLIIYALLILFSLLIMPETNLQPIKLQGSSIVKNYLIVLRHPVFWSGVIGMGVVYSLIAIFNVVGPFLIQTVMHYSPIQFGHIALVMGFAFFLGGIFNRILVQKFNARFLVLSSILVMALASILLLILGLLFPPKLYYYIIPSFIILFFSAPIFPAGMAKSMSLFPKIAGSASAVMGFLFTAFTAITTVVASFLVSSNQISSAIAYLVLIAICFLAYQLLNK